MKDVRELVNVKPLGWKFDEEIDTWRASAAGFDYAHWQGRDSNWYTAHEHDYFATSPPRPEGHATKDVAAAACQKLHESRIYALLEPLPEPPEASK